MVRENYLKFRKEVGGLPENNNVSEQPDEGKFALKPMKTAKYDPY